MDRTELLALIEGLRTGSISHAEAQRQVERQTFEDLGFAKLDHQRTQRTGFPEVVFAEPKTDAQLLEICRAHLRAQPRLLVTRLAPERHAILTEALAELSADGRYNTTARTLSFGWKHIQPAGFVAVVCAGTADLPVAEEAAETARL